MRLSRILSRYLVREVLVYASLGALALGSIFVAQNMFKRLETFLGTGFHAGDFFVVLGSVLVLMAGYLIPVGFLFGILVAVGRMAADSEVKAMRACGLGLTGILAPILLLAVPVSLLTGVMVTRFEPEARRDLRALWRTVLSRGAFLTPGRFISVGERVVFVEHVGEENALSGVVISDHSNPERPFMVVAQGGRFYVDEASSLVHLELADGDIHFEPRSERDAEHRHIGFQRFDYPIEAGLLLREDVGRLKPRDMRMGELREIIARARAGDPLEELRYQDVDRYVGQVHRRLSLAATPLCFALVATPLALRRARGGRSWGALVCVGLVFGYYALMSFGEYLLESGSTPPQVAAWMPNAAFLLLAVPLLWRSQRAPI